MSNAALIAALERVKQILTIPAAEYVPAIPDAWAVIDAALSSEAQSQRDARLSVPRVATSARDTEKPFQNNLEGEEP